MFVCKAKVAMKNKQTYKQTSAILFGLVWFVFVDLFVVGLLLNGFVVRLGEWE